MCLPSLDDSFYFCLYFRDFASNADARSLHSKDSKLMPLPAHGVLPVEDGLMNDMF